MPHQLAGLCRLLLLASSSALAAQNTLLRVDGSQSAAMHGLALASSFDLDGDGWPDFAIGAPGWAGVGPNSGRVEVRSGRDGQLLQSLEGREPGAFFGWSVACLGDVDGDRVVDFVVGSPRAVGSNGELGMIQVLSGRQGNELWRAIAMNRGDLFGSAVAALGDVDSDGVSDLAAGAPQNGDPLIHYGPGYVRVLSGRSGLVRWTRSGRGIGHELGHSVAAIGDLDRDGVTEVAVGAPLETNDRATGGVSICSGRDGSELHRLFAPGLNDHFGASICAAGDLDRDGVPDLVVGSAELTSGLPGRAWAFAGKGFALLHVLSGTTAGDMLGASLAGGEDIDHDGFPDYVVGAPGDVVAGQRCGRARLVSGRDGSVLRTFEGTRMGDMLGMTCLFADVDRDGTADFLLGSPGFDGLVADGGRVQIVAAAPTSSVGRGCGAASPPPALRGTAAVLGRDFVLQAESHPGLRSGAAFLSAVPAVPSALPRGCAVYLDPGDATMFAAVLMGPGGRWERSWPVPQDANLLGARVAFQLVLEEPRAPLGLALSNGVYVEVQRP